MELLLHGFALASAKAAGGLLSAIWEGAVLAACVAACLRLTARLTAAARSVVWMAVFLLLMVLNVAPSFENPGPAGGALSASPFHLDPLWSVGIAGVWAVLSLWRGAQLALSAIRLHGLSARATRVYPGAALEKLLKAGKGFRTAELCTSDEVGRPSVRGFFRPRILLPSGLYERLAPFELEQVVCHEMEHLRRADDWTNLLQKAGLVLFPLNPVLLWVERRLCAERELACDDRVLRSSGGRKTYAICLTRLAEYAMIRRGLSLALGAWEHQSELARRVQRILRGPNEPLSSGPAMALMGALILAVTAGAIGLAHSPRLVSFAPLPTSPAMQAFAAQRPVNLSELSGSPRLVKAVFPERTQKPLSTLHNAKRRSAVAEKRNVRPLEAFPNQTEWLVVTQWEEAGLPERIVITVARQNQTFAAVATANGWLIVQI